ncbi:hypothetical protein CKO43_15555 [Rubrivivax gelatinosus]|uniref:Uncharacterized protein n=2 Tax=Rubrivivax gelatinosus TaxID=28068 RepID=A0ABS1DVX6_RUBGE|nr:hypothetical protein [Rubrivivax gelatinosus]
MHRADRLENLMQKTVIAAACLAAALAADVFAAAPAGDGPDARYQRERAACLSDPGGAAACQTCLREAGAALAEARRGQLGDDSGPQQWRANALRRCQAQPASERELCERLTLGEGRQQGSVQEGAIVRELVTVVPGAPVPPPPPPPPATPR